MRQFSARFAPRVNAPLPIEFGSLSNGSRKLGSTLEPFNGQRRLVYLKTALEALTGNTLELEECPQAPREIRGVAGNNKKGTPRSWSGLLQRSPSTSELGPIEGQRMSERITT